MENSTNTINDIKSKPKRVRTSKKQEENKPQSPPSPPDVKCAIEKPNEPDFDLIVNNIIQSQEFQEFKNKYASLSSEIEELHDKFLMKAVDSQLANFTNKKKNTMKVIKLLEKHIDEL